MNLICWRGESAQKIPTRNPRYRIFLLNRRNFASRRRGAIRHLADIHERARRRREARARKYPRRTRMRPRPRRRPHRGSGTVVKAERTRRRRIYRWQEAAASTGVRLLPAPASPPADDDSSSGAGANWSTDAARRPRTARSRQPARIPRPRAPPRGSAVSDWCCWPTALSRYCRPLENRAGNRRCGQRVAKIRWHDESLVTNRSFQRLRYRCATQLLMP